MFKKLLFLALALTLVVSLMACGEETKTLKCGSCGKDVKVAADSEVDESWGVLCKSCEDKILSEIGDEK